mgnify:CR=1 FL=1
MQVSKLKTEDIHRQLPFTKVIRVSNGDDIPLRFPMKDENGTDISSGTFTSLTLKVYRRAGRDLGQLVSTTVQANMTIALPNVDATIKVTSATVEWSNQTKGMYKAILSCYFDGSRVTPSAFLIEVTD